MPKVSRNHRYKFKKEPPEGFSKIEHALNSFSEKMKEAEKQTLEVNRPKYESTWKITMLNHQRSRYIFDLYYKRKLISRKLYDWLIANKFADKELIAKWKKKGYEKLCCLQCIQVGNTNQQTTCICRVPKASMNGSDNEQGKHIRCKNCGCRGCASTD
ncbi:hypothetical protein BRETT_001116 [Brettanomyces bruxellensis]|uniref:G10 protein n=1 Tax=Dekkera bruxellensis TaxID=5007 RepID=A0A871R9M8_DEKBR|nr:uncharacterized protein BRETT_001116 [Brettanomyces bruxellensis]QOU21394.1 hypothetical protein BRETT_001116 [Brettanomyces bruxellensis]